jgi:iron(III) transport system permease protein
MGTRLKFALHRISNRPELILTVGFIGLLAFLVITPLIEIINDSLAVQSYDLSYLPDAEEGSFTFFHFGRVFTGRLSWSLFYKPFANSLMVGAGVTVLCISVTRSRRWP